MCRILARMQNVPGPSCPGSPASAFLMSSSAERRPAPRTRFRKRTHLRACLAAILLCAAAVVQAEIPAPVGDFIARLSIESPGALGKLNLNTSEGDFPTILAAPKEGMKIALTVPASLVGKAIQIRAGDGGVVKGATDGAFSVAAEGNEGLLKFEYFLGGTTGRSSLKILAPGYMQILEFWVGPRPPQGAPGPALKFSAPRIETAKS
jgi:hypothetical protein